MTKEERDIRKLAIEQLSKETEIAEYFVEIDLHDAFVSRCIKLALVRGKKLAKKRLKTKQSEI